MGSVGTERGSVGRSVEAAIKNVEKNPIEVSKEEADDIKAATYGLATGRLSDADKQKLISLVGKKRDINAGKTVQVSLAKLSKEGLKDMIRITSKIGSTASTFAMEDAFKLLSYKR